MITQSKTTIKKILSKLFDKIISTARGKALILNFLYENPQICIEAFGRMTNLSQRFENVSNWPDNIDNFEELYFLFSCTQLNMGIANLALDEAAYLYKIVKSLNSANLVEIGRFKGGGTFLMAAAMDENSELLSYDLHVKMKNYFDGEVMDEVLKNALERYGLSERTRIIVGDSSKVDVGSEPVDLVFIDGDHSYEGVKKDFLHWHKSVKPGGHLLFHDSAKTREFTTYREDVARYVSEMTKDFAEYFHKLKEVGSISHFIRSEAPFDKA